MNYADAQDDIIYMAVQELLSNSFLSISFDFPSIFDHFGADFISFMLFLFFFEQYLVFFFGTGTRGWYRGPSVLSWSI